LTPIVSESCPWDHIETSPTLDRDTKAPNPLLTSNK